MSLSVAHNSPVDLCEPVRALRVNITKKRMPFSLKLFMLPCWTCCCICARWPWRLPPTRTNFTQPPGYSHGKFLFWLRSFEMSIRFISPFCHLPLVWHGVFCFAFLFSTRTDLVPWGLSRHASCRASFSYSSWSMDNMCSRYSCGHWCVSAYELFSRPTARHLYPRCGLTFIASRMPRLQSTGKAPPLCQRQ